MEHLRQADELEQAMLVGEHSAVPTGVIEIERGEGTCTATVLYANRAALSRLGRGPALVGMNAGSLISPETNPAVVAELRAAVRARRDASAEIAIDTGSGRTMWVIISLRIVRYDITGPVRFVVSAVDISGRRAAELRVRESEAILRLATNAGEIGVWVRDLESGVLQVDTTAAHILGSTPSRLRSVDDWLKFVHPDDLPALTPGAGVGVGGLDVGGSTFRIVRSDGVERYVLTRGRVFGGGASGAKSVGTIVDVTAAQELAIRLKDTLESISDAYYAVDSDWNMTYVNRHGERLLEVPANELVGTSLWDHFPAEESLLEVKLRESMTTRRPVSFEGSYAQLGTWYEVRAFPLRDGLAIYFTDITDRKSVEQQRDRLLASEREARLRAEEAQELLSHQATHDALTGLVNRAELTRRLVSHIARGGSERAAVMFVDVDHFKWVNDSLGHAVGDFVLVELAKRFLPLVRGGDIVARLGGDEFVVVLFNADANIAEQVGERLAAEARVPFHVDGKTFGVTVSVGLALEDDHASADSLIRDADMALYRAKENGRDQVAWFQERARHEMSDRAIIEAELRTAVTEGQLTVYYQPSWNLVSNKITDVEALVRWNHPTRGVVTAADFVPVTEETGLVVELGRFVLERAIADAVAWQQWPDVTVWVNVSPRQLVGPGLSTMILETIAKYGLEPSRFGVEITETTLVDAAASDDELRALHAAGVRIAIDDYGTGYSSLSRLRLLPLDTIKIDRSLVSDVGTGTGGAVVDSVVQLARALGATTVAEGVEDRDQLDEVRRRGCTSAAGYLLARPMPADELMAYLTDSAET